jgi:hypothetical protein
VRVVHLFIALRRRHGGWGLRRGPLSLIHWSVWPFKIVWEQDLQSQYFRELSPWTVIQSFYHAWKYPEVRAQPASILLSASETTLLLFAISERKTSQTTTWKVPPAIKKRWPWDWNVGFSQKRALHKSRIWSASKLSAKWIPNHTLSWCFEIFLNEWFLQSTAQDLSTVSLHLRWQFRTFLWGSTSDYDSFFHPVNDSIFISQKPINCSIYDW